MMNKILKMTLFKKIFLMIMSGFMIILISFTYLIVQFQKENIKSEIIDDFYDYQIIKLLQDDLQVIEDHQYNYTESLKKVRDIKFKNKINEYNRINEGEVAVIRRNYKNQFDIDHNKNEIIISTFDETDYIRIENQKYSLENFTKTQKESLLAYLEKCLNQGNDMKTHLTYHIQNNQISYLSWDNQSYGQKDKMVKKTYVYDFCILNKIVCENAIDGKLMIIDINDIKEAIRKIDFYIGESNVYSIEEIEENHQTYYISMGYVGGDYKPMDETTRDKDFLNIINIKVADHMNEYVIQECIEQNWWIYVVSLIVLIIISWCLSTIIAYPISKIQISAMKIANQEFDEEIKIKSKDEIGNLAESINTMRIQLKNTIQQLNIEIQRVKELEGLRKDFINQFTHEMKTPLGIINGYSELIEEAENDEEKQKYLDIINKETIRINELIQAMLSLSRLEAGKVELNQENIDLEDIITEIVDEYEVLLMKKKVKVEVEVKDNCIKADKKQIITVIRNFMSNAIKHVNEEGRIKITVDQGISVYNEGEKIEEERLESIWYTFVTHDQGGSGLGLAICRSILELHGFDYGVKNINEGVEFYFQGNQE